MGSGSARAATAAAHLFGAAALLLLMLARGGESVSFWLPPPSAGVGGEGFLGGASRYLTLDERWMNQTLDHFNPTVCIHCESMRSLRTYVEEPSVVGTVGNRVCSFELGYFFCKLKMPNPESS